MERYDPDCGYWENLAPLSLPRRSLGAVRSANCLLVFGGVIGDDSVATAIISRYDPRSNEWLDLSDGQNGGFSALSRNLQ